MADISVIGSKGGLVVDETELNAFLNKQNWLNITSFGITSETPTAAIQEALDARPNESFFFPPTIYNLDEGLLITKGNSLRFAKGAVLRAIAPMDTLLSVAHAGSGYLEDAEIIGGEFDGNLMANRLISLQKVIHFTIARARMYDGINRGLVTEAGLGAELVLENSRIFNTTATNYVDNIAIELNMGDSHIRDVFVRDWTVAGKDTSANRWNRFHPWISQDTQANPNMTNRYPISIGMDITGASDVVDTVMDTYRTAYKIRSNGTGYTAPPRFTNSRAMWAVDPMLTTALATQYPAAVYDNTDGVGFYHEGMSLNGHSNATAANFLTGPQTNVTTRNNRNIGYIKAPSGSVSNQLEYRNGVRQGLFTFTPTIIGSGGAGVHAYTTQSGRMIVEKDEVSYQIRVRATLDNTTAFAGAIRIGGIPFPDGNTNIRDAGGVVAYASNVPAATGFMFGTSTGGAAPVVNLYSPVTATGTAEIDIPGNALRGKTVEIAITLRTTHFTQ